MIQRELHSVFEGKCSALFGGADGGGWRAWGGGRAAAVLNSGPGTPH